MATTSTRRARDFTANVNIDKVARIARVDLAIGDDKFEGTIGEKEAREHCGDIFNHVNFIAYIEHALAANAETRAAESRAARACDAEEYCASSMPAESSASHAQPMRDISRDPAYRSKVWVDIAQDRESAVLNINVTMSFTSATFSDTLPIRCSRKKDASPATLDECAREIVALRAEIATVRAQLRDAQDTTRVMRASFNKQMAISYFCARSAKGHLHIPARGYGFYMELITKHVEHNPVTFPIIGPDFVRIGNEYFRWELPSRNIVSHNVVCCYYPQFRKPFAMRGLSRTSIDSRTEWMRGAGAMSMAVIGHSEGDHSMRYFALSPWLLSDQYMRSFTPIDTRAFFGIEFHSRFNFFFCTQDPQGIARTPITREFARACDATAHLIALAHASGMISLGVAHQ